MLFAVTWMFYEWIQHPALHKHHDQTMTNFEWNLLHGLWAHANLVEWFPLVSFCDIKPVSHLFYCLNLKNRKSPANILTSNQCCYIENETKSDVGFSTLHNVDTTSVRESVKTTLHNVEATLHKVGTTLIQCCFSLASMLVKAILNPIGLVMIMALQIDE